MKLLGAILGLAAIILAAWLLWAGWKGSEKAADDAGWEAIVGKAGSGQE